MAIAKGYDGLELLPDHEKLLSESAIAPEIALDRGYRTITKKTHLRDLGFKGYQCSVPALLIPLWSATGEIASYQTRPNCPRVNDGKALKYETPSGSRVVLDVPPAARPYIGDPGRPLFITEGIRKADSAVGQGLCCIAVIGVWNFRGTNDHGGKTALADWEYVHLKGRRAFICYDSDVMTNPNVCAAMNRLKAFLEQRGAQVMLIYLPSGPGGTKVGLDDYFAAGNSVDDLLLLASPELRKLADDDEEPFVPYAATPHGLVRKKGHPDGTRLTNFTATIVADVSEDDGAEIRRIFKIEAQLGGRTRTFDVSAKQFGGMNWPVEHLGAGALIYPGMNLKDHARAAIQMLSGDIPEVQVYAHTGWRRINDRWVYLHAAGAISTDGGQDMIHVRLPDTLRAYSLPEAPEGESLRAAIRKSLEFLNLAPDTTVFPLYSAIWRAPLDAADFSIHLTGPTGAGKSVLAALAQQHFGAGMDSRHLPGSWSSTANALEAVAFAAKEALFVIDDFCPRGSSTEVSRLHAKADRVLRAQGNNAGRQRMGSEMTLRASNPPRGLIISTGEDTPKGHSLRARMLIIEISPTSLDFARLTSSQQCAQGGVFAQVMAGYLRWLAERMETLRPSLGSRITELRKEATQSNLHRRTPEIIANLAIALLLFLEFAVDSGAVPSHEASVLYSRAWKALGEAASRQGEHQTSSEPAYWFLELLGAAIMSGRAHVANRNGGHPESPERWGWRKNVSGAADSPIWNWHPQGNQIGWVDGEDLYLQSTASQAVAQKMARDHGDELTIGSTTLHKRLHEKGMLASTDKNRKTLTVRHMILGDRKEVLHLKSSTLLCSEHDQPDHSPDLALNSGQVGGQVHGRILPTEPLTPDQVTCPLSRSEQAESPRMVGLVGLSGPTEAAQREALDL